MIAIGFSERAVAVDFHVATAQELQNALSLAAANNADDIVYLASGRYVGNFNYNSTEARSLTLQAEPGLANDKVTIDGAGVGRSMSLSCSANANITVRGMTFLRDCGSTENASLRVATGPGADVLVEDCRFVSPTNSSGIGLEITFGLNAIVRRCTVAGVRSGGGGIGMRITGTSSMSVENCSVTANQGRGLYCALGSRATIGIVSNVFTGNVGGAYCDTAFGATVTIFGNSFTSNSVGGFSYGGGVAVYGEGTPSTITLSSNTFSGNSASGYLEFGGGGAYCYGGTGGTVILSGNSFTGNSSANGGGANCAASTVMLFDNSFIGNFGGPGGGFYCGLTPTTRSTTLTLLRNIISENSAVFLSQSGGGAYCAVTTTTISGNKINLNTARESGGGLYVTAPTVRILNNLIVANAQTDSAHKGAGLYVNANAILDMINNTVTDNTAAGSGGGVAFQVDGTAEVLHVYNNIVRANKAVGSGADVHLAGTGQRREFLFNNAQAIFGVWDVFSNNLDVDPQFVDASNGDFHLKSGSLCINAGTNGAPQLPTTDFDGRPRIFGGTVDLGALEFASGTPDSDGDGALDADEVFAGTDPQNSASVFKTITPEPGGAAQFVIRWSSVAGKIYSIEKATSLTSGFSELASPITATPPVNSYTDILPAGSGTVFYRVRVR